MTEYKKRYLAVDDAEHSCCFGASVVDTTKINKSGEGSGKPLREFERVCECYDYDTARRIEQALNGDN